MCYGHGTKIGLLGLQESQNLKLTDKIIQRCGLHHVSSSCGRATLFWDSSWDKGLRYQFSNHDRFAAAIFGHANRVCAISLYLPDESVDDAVSIYGDTLQRVSRLAAMASQLPGTRGSMRLLVCADANVELPPSMIV